MSVNIAKDIVAILSYYNVKRDGFKKCWDDFYAFVTDARNLNDKRLHREYTNEDYQGVVDQIHETFGTNSQQKEKIKTICRMVADILHVNAPPGKAIA